MTDSTQTLTRPGPRLRKPRQPRLDLAPVLEEIAERYGFYACRVRGGCLILPADDLARLEYFDRQVAPEDVIQYLEEQGLAARRIGEGVELPSTVRSRHEFRQWRSAWRNLWQMLSEENSELGRRSHYRWNRPRTVDGKLEDELTLSREWLKRAYAGDFIPAEKKGLVADLRSSRGMYLASLDRDEFGPRYALLDSSSQVASFIGGFNSNIQQGLLHHPEVFANPDYRETDLPIVGAFKRLLREAAHPSLKHVCFVNSGSEAVEKALALARHKYPEKGSGVIAFDGSFHGRTLLALFSSWNPSKRIPFQVPGFETTFVDFPIHLDPASEPPIPAAWVSRWERAIEGGPLDFPEAAGEPLLALEVRILNEIREHLKTGRFFSVVMEPVQCEGGDRYATARFARGLRALTSAFGVALIFDEVQSGMGLGGTLYWHTRFALHNRSGQPVAPDFVCLAKKSQAGVVLSTVPDPHPSAAHLASILRGYYNAKQVDRDAIEAMGDKVRARLRAVAAKHPQTVSNARNDGLMFSFDLPTTEAVNAFLEQRFHRGCMVYNAGTHTIRYRLQTITTDRDLDAIFECIDRSLAHLEGQPHGYPDKSDHNWKEPIPARSVLPDSFAELEKADWNGILQEYQQLPPEEFEDMLELCGDDPLAWYRAERRRYQETRQGPRPPTWMRFIRFLATLKGVRTRFLTEELWERYRDQIMDIEHRAYEPVRRDTEEFLERIVRTPGQVSFVALQGERVLAFSMAAPLESFPNVRGPHEDPEFGRHTCLYSADICVDPECHRMGLGRRLKRRLLKRARHMGYRWIRSRNRVDATPAMMHINLSLDSYDVKLYEKDYGEDEADCLYSSQPLQLDYRREVHWSNGVEEPTGGRLESPEDWEDWDLAAMNKLSLCNWMTPNVIRHVEWIRAHAPQGLGHLYLSSGRAEATDKCIKTLFFHRKGAQFCVSFDGAYWGETTAASRSLSDPVFGTYFPWMHVPYPAVEGNPFREPEGALTPLESLSLQRLREIVQPDPAKFIGVFLEPIQEKTGRRVSIRFLRALRALCEELDVPLAYNEAASWAYRGAPSLFYTSTAGVTPDALVFYGGGQLGHTLVNDRYFIKQPLQMISTWDGDELSALRLREQVREIEGALDEDFLRRADREIAESYRGDTWRGTGRIQLKPGAGENEVRVRPSLQGEGWRVLLPPLNRLKSDWRSLLRALR